MEDSEEREYVKSLVDKAKLLFNVKSLSVRVRRFSDKYYIFIYEKEENLVLDEELDLYKKIFHFNRKV